LFDQLDLGKRMRHLIVDLCDAAAVRRVVKRVQPDFVFHLAAQPLVRDSYAAPVATYAINVLGTAHLLDAVRTIARPCAVICVTTDKCYENRETLRGYREDDPLGGHDPYSSSKAAAEIAIAAWRRSFFSGHPVKIASARAGNAIGGGDWARDRIVPDCVRSLRRGEVIQVRNPASVRPWQHVLEPLSGYLWLAAALSHPVLTGQPLERLCSAFNFGPTAEANQSVGELVNEMLRHWRGRWEDTGDARRLHEAKLLRLTTDKARLLLGWTPAWGFREAIAGTVEWYRTAAQRPSGSVLRELTSRHFLGR
jgi:CDP-glucose 4,6-dehydratase